MDGLPWCTGSDRSLKRMDHLEIPDSWPIQEFTCQTANFIPLERPFSANRLVARSGMAEPIGRVLCPARHIRERLSARSRMVEQPRQVVLTFTDTQRRDMLGIYGHHHGIEMGPPRDAV